MNLEPRPVTPSSDDWGTPTLEFDPHWVEDRDDDYFHVECSPREMARHIAQIHLM